MDCKLVPESCLHTDEATRVVSKAWRAMVEWYGGCEDLDGGRRDDI